MTTSHDHNISPCIIAILFLQTLPYRISSCYQIFSSYSPTLNSQSFSTCQSIFQNGLILQSSSYYTRKSRKYGINSIRIHVPKAWNSLIGGKIQITGIKNSKIQSDIIDYSSMKKRRRDQIASVLFGLILVLLSKPAFSLSIVTRSPIASIKSETIFKIGIWVLLFTSIALLHATEISITTLYPWKVREFAEKEEKDPSRTTRKGIFQILNDDITNVLTTISVTSTAASIYATTLFTDVASVYFGSEWNTLLLTAITLFFVELIPKSIGVMNAERVARVMVPPINLISKFVSPLGMALSWLSQLILKFFGLTDTTGNCVSDLELRLILTGARDSGTIDHSEQEMIKGVLNLHSQRIKEVMKPRVDIISIPKEMNVASVLSVIRKSGYSRIPVYDGEIDTIVGIVLAKDVLDFFVQGVMNVDHSDIGKESDLSIVTTYSSVNEKMTQGCVRALTGIELASWMELSVMDAQLIEECYFVPDTANGWSVLQEMRKRHIHMAIVVDEYGGTEGLVSLEDIVEEIVGEIYDEDDEDFEFTEDSITIMDDGSFHIRGDADLEYCDMILNLNLDEEEALKEFGTLSGFLCMCAGEIPKVDDFILSRGWSFEVKEADLRRILMVKVEKLIENLDE